MWELGYITLRSAKWRGYLVGQFHSVYEHSFLHPKHSTHPKDHGGVRLPTRRMGKVCKQPGSATHREELRLQLPLCLSR